VRGKRLLGIEVSGGDGWELLYWCWA